MEYITAYLNEILLAVLIAAWVKKAEVAAMSREQIESYDTAAGWP